MSYDRGYPNAQVLLSLAYQGRRTGNLENVEPPGHGERDGARRYYMSQLVKQTFFIGW